MQAKRTPVLLAGLLALSGTAGGALAEDDAYVWTGSLGAGYRYSNISGSPVNGAYSGSGTCTSASAAACAPVQLGSNPVDRAKASEYRDLSSGLIGTVDVQGSNQTSYMKFFGENFGYQDQYLDLRGGQYGSFKYQVFQDKMPHNLSWNTLTPMTGTGGTVLGGTRNVNPNTWNSADYALQRQNMGANFEWASGSPWYARADVNEVTMKGTRPQSGRLGTSSSFGFEDFGAPVDYKTTNFQIEGGYAVKRGSLSVAFLDSRFKNPNDTLQWPNFYLANQLDTSLLPPDNDLRKFSFNGVLRELPASSILHGRFTYSQLTNGFNVLSTGLLPTNPPPNTTTPLTPAQVGTSTTAPSSANFNGEHITKSASLSLTSNWAKGVDSKLFWNYYKKDNSSTAISYSAGVGPGLVPIAATPAVTPFAFRKNQFGLDLGWRINPQHKVSGGLDFLDTNRTRLDSDQTNDRKAWAEYKNNSFENFTGRVKYERLARNSDLDPANPPAQNNQTPATVQYYFRSYDVSNFDQDRVKLVGDWNVIPLLDVGAEAALKQTRYKDLFYGRTNDHRREYNLTIGYGDPRAFRVTALANYEFIQFDQAYHNGTSPATPGAPQTATNFDWGTTNTQTNRLLALIADWSVNERLALKASYTWTKTGGGVDFTSGNTTGAGGFNGGPLVNYLSDNTRKQTLNLKGDYRFTKTWSATLGYVHERYDFNDDQMKGFGGFYGYYVNLGQQNQAWLSGAFANPSYRLDVVYATTTYHFD